MYNKVMVKVCVVRTLQISDIESALENAKRGWRSALTSCEKMVTSITVPFDFEIESFDYVSRTAMDVASNFIYDEGCYRVDINIESQTIYSCEFNMLWDADKMVAKLSICDDLLSQLRNLYKLYQEIDDKENSHLYQIIKDYPEFLDFIKEGR